MSSTSIDTAIYHPDESSPASSYLIGSASASSPSLQWNDKKISRAFTQAKNAYSTRQFVQAYSALQPLITASSDQEDESPPTGSAPIVKAKPSLRIKVWCLYLSVLSELIDSGSAEFQSAHGREQYDSIKSKLVNGFIWEQVIKDGYEGQLSSVDAVVVQALGLHLVRKAASQNANIAYLETYLSTIPAPSSQDPTAYDLVLQTLILAVLKDGQEPYARELTSRLETLDDDQQREDFLQTLIHAEGLEQPPPPAPPQPEQDPPTKELLHPPPITPKEPHPSSPEERPHRSQQDYGIEEPPPQSKPRTIKALHPPSSKLPFFTHISRSITAFRDSVLRGSTLRFLLFLAALLAALTRRRDVKEVLRRAVGKVRQTVGMGVKVSYI